jgi:protein-S-isoprenylcysteine O-methyltransferase Ste14
MSAEAVYHWGALCEIAIAAIAFPLLFWITVPYGGRHTSDRWGPTIPSRLAWLAMEAPAPLACAIAYACGRNAGEPVSLVFLAAFLVHYAHRANPRTRSPGKRTPVVAAGVAMLVNVLNGTINGLAIGHVVDYGRAWLEDPRFWIGALLFVLGSAINRRADATLRRLRRPLENGYRIPEGGLYRWLSSPNYLGEIVQWGGWAIATWSAAGLAFFALTIANLVPRARSNHAWYRAAFPGYPPERRRLIPGIW